MMRNLAVILIALLCSSVTAQTTSTLVFTKAAGPAWLIVETSGTLSGTPQFNDIGLNVFTVRVEDDLGVSDEAELHIQVLPALRFRLEIIQATAREAISFSRFALDLNDWMD